MIERLRAGALARRTAEAAYAFSQRLGASGTGYADLIFHPTHWKPWHGRLREMIDALDAGFRAAEHDGLPLVGLCASLLRRQSSDAAAGRTGPRFAEAFRRAGAAGLKRTVHAGGSSGPEGVRDAIELLGADRIDHGVRAIEDPAVVALLVERQVPLGVCPTSNLRLGVCPSMAEHPIERLRRAGVAVSVNTDDPALLGTSLAREYAMCSEAFAWSDADVRAIAHTSIDASFANGDVKARLRDALSRW